VQYRIRVPCNGTASKTTLYCDCIDYGHSSVYYFTILCCSRGLHFCANTGYTGVCREPEQESLVGSGQNRSTLHRYRFAHQGILCLDRICACHRILLYHIM